MNLFKRLFRIGTAEANSAVDKIEDPSKMADQIIRELNENLQEALSAQAGIKATALQTRANENKERGMADEWENKAMKLVGAKREDLANTAAITAQEHNAAADKYKSDADKQDAALAIMDKKIKGLRDAITEAKQRAEMIKSNEKVAEASLSINKALSNIDIDGLMSTLDRMEAKTSAKQFMADAYESIDNANQSTAAEIDEVLADSNKTNALDALKAKYAKDTKI